MYLPARQLHAYLEGVGIELIANSDNVLRGGLTPKHIDHDALMHTIQFEAKDPGIMNAHENSRTEAFYRTPAEEFSLGVLSIDSGMAHQSPEHHNVEILLLTKGRCTLETLAGGVQLELQQGDSVLVPAAAGVYRLAGQGVVYRASVPDPV